MLKYFQVKNPITSSSSGLGYTELEQVESPFGRLQSYTWFLSTAKSNGAPASLFKYSSKHHDYPGQNTDLEFAERHLRCIKLLLHPNILKVLKVKQTDSSIAIATERCYPLSQSTVSSDPALGFSQLMAAIHFLHTKCNKTNCLVTPLGVVARDDGSWCLGSFECAVDNEMSIHRVLSELKWHASWKDGWRPPMPSNASVSVRQLDQWGLGALMCWVYALLSGNVELCNLRRQDCDLHALRRFAPANLHGLIDQLMSPTHDVDLEEVLSTHPYFCSNVAVSAMSFAVELHIKTDEQVGEFFAQLPSQLARIPIDIACKQLLPEILKAISIHKALVPRILESVVKICKSMLVEDFRAKVYPHISGLFKENDRSIRYSLLKLMPDLDPLLDENEMSDDLFEPMLIGFSDSASQIRDETVKAMVYVMKKIKRRQQHSASLLLFKCVEDVEPTIRVNSIICFAKIIPFIQPDLLGKVIPQVWRTGLRDPFLKSRVASLESISASHGFFGTEQKIEILLPLACSTLLDKEQQVRRLGLETVYAILDSLKGHVMGGDKGAADRQWASASSAPVTPAAHHGSQQAPQPAPHPMSLTASRAAPGPPASAAPTPTARPSAPGLRLAPAPSVPAASAAASWPDINSPEALNELEDFFDSFPAKK